MLFSEPKIPQSEWCGLVPQHPCCFSALQRAENSSIATYHTSVVLDSRFSALQRAENSSIRTKRYDFGCPLRCFSALQRAENSSIPFFFRFFLDVPVFQCSSASRKFLNYILIDICRLQFLCFSALQRAENSSIAERGVGE